MFFLYYQAYDSTVPWCQMPSWMNVHNASRKLKPSSHLSRRAFPRLGRLGSLRSTAPSSYRILAGTVAPPRRPAWRTMLLRNTSDLRIKPAFGVALATALASTRNTLVRKSLITGEKFHVLVSIRSSIRYNRR